MGFLGRILPLVSFGLLLQFAGSDVHASTSPTEQSVAACSVQFTSGDQQSVNQNQSVVSVHTTSAEDCDNGACSGLTCSCSCHGMVAAIVALPLALPMVPAATMPQASPRGFTQIGVIPPVRPPKI